MRAIRAKAIRRAANAAYDWYGVLPRYKYVLAMARPPKIPRTIELHPGSFRHLYQRLKRACVRGKLDLEVT